MGARGIIYRSAECRTEEQARVYVQTHQAPHRYLAYRDIPDFIRKFVVGRKTLDYGAGTGASSSFLSDLGFDVIGVDISPDMLEMANTNFPFIKFCSPDNLTTGIEFDMIFSSFVLFELPSKEIIVQYLSNSFSLLKNNGIFIGITGSEDLYSLSRQWATFDANFEENRKLRSGDIAKLSLKFPKMEFYDYYWKENDYLDCFKTAGLKILQVHYPLGSLEDPYSWNDELSFSPFTVFVAQKIQN